MKKNPKKIFKLFLAICIFYALTCVILFFRQESFIFFPSKLSESYRFQFDQDFEEIFIPIRDDIKLHGLLFKSSRPKGLIFYLHGNGGAVDTWGYMADTYTSLGYDLFILDYRGYGKSNGKIESEAQFYTDAQATYNFFKDRYEEKNMIVIGYSIGTAAATKLAADNHPKMLILQAPYYSLTDMMMRLYPFLPGVILKYKFETYKFIQRVEVPIYIFHGNVDELIDYESSVKLQKYFKPGDQLIMLEGQGHNGINENYQFRTEMNNLLGD